MKRTIFIVALLTLGFSITACGAPVKISKYYDEFTFEGDKVRTHYHEAIEQKSDEKLPVLTTKQDIKNAPPLLQSR